MFLRGRQRNVLLDALAVSFALVLAYTIRFDFDFPALGSPYFKQCFLLLPYVVLLRLSLLVAFGSYRVLWRYIGLADLPPTGLAVISGTAVLVLVRLVSSPLLLDLGFHNASFYVRAPWGVLALELLLSLTGIFAVRILRKVDWDRRRGGVARDLAQTQAKVASDRPRAVLVGAGSAGFLVAGEILANPEVGFEVVGFVDDDPEKHKRRIQGFRVLGTTAEIQTLVQAYRLDLGVITMPGASGDQVRRVVDRLEAAGLSVKTIPSLQEILSGQVQITNIREVSVEDLLRRDPVKLEQQAIEAFVTGKRVMVTGAGGSIGSEICRQVCAFHPAVLLLLDQAENPLFHIRRELEHRFPEVTMVSLVRNVAEQQRLAAAMAEHRPEVVFHAAAHKHVPMMELNPGEALRNNVGGSATVARLAHRFEAEAFVMISTDKAVNPTSVMGASKRVAELFVQALGQTSQTRFITVRFGNVLGSAGSVVPIFEEQIARGGPVTVTHPEMKRYFMTIPEASQLVLQAATMGRGGEIFVLEMGEPVRILSLAERLIRQKGLAPYQDIPIEFSGVRPGEKLYEEISLSEENADKTRHPRIWIGRSRSRALAEVERQVAELRDLADRATPEQVRQALRQVVPEYVPDPNNAPRPVRSSAAKAAARDAAPSVAPHPPPATA